MNLLHYVASLSHEIRRVSMRAEKYFIDIVKNPQGIPVKSHVLSQEEVEQMLESGYEYIPITKRKLSKKHKKMIDKLLQDYTDVPTTK